MNLHGPLGKAVGSIVESRLREEKRNTISMYETLRNGHRDGVKIITELKLSSPSKGDLRIIEKNDIRTIVEEFEAGGASAISVLVEPRLFGGSIENLEIVRELTDLPLLAKGFLFSPAHLVECTAAGANAYLFMVRLLDVLGQDLKEFFDLGNSLGIDAIIEANTSQEINKSLELNPKILEVNNRNIYSDLSINLRKAALGKSLRKDITFVSASGIESAEDINKVYQFSGKRVDAVLVGTSLMRSQNINRKVREFVTAGEEVIK